MTARPTLKELVAVLNERVGNFNESNKKDHAELKESIEVLSKHCNHEVEILSEQVKRLEEKDIAAEAEQKAFNKIAKRNRKIVYYVIVPLVAAVVGAILTIIFKLQ